MRYCPRIKNLIGSWDFKDGYLSIARMRCRQWDCPYCAVKNADMWRGHLLHVFCEELEDEKWIFVTLTLAPWQHRMSFEKGLACLKEAWGNLYDRLRYKMGGKIKYVLVYETHKSGVFHAHCLVNMGAIYDTYTVWDWSVERSPAERISDEKMHGLCVWLQRQCENEGIGSVCHITRIREGDTGKDNARLAIGYITKYFSKGLEGIVLPKRWRRICTSRDIGSPRSRSKSKYSWTLKNAIHYKHAMQQKIWLVSEGRVLNSGDFGDSEHYPPLDE